MTWLRCSTSLYSTIWMNEWRLGSAMQHVTFQDGGPQEIQWSKQHELYRNNYQLWAADVDTSWEKLLFEINITGQLRFPLKPRYHTPVTFFILQSEVCKAEWRRVKLKRCVQWLDATNLNLHSPIRSLQQEERLKNCMLKIISVTDIFSQIVLLFLHQY